MKKVLFVLLNLCLASFCTAQAFGDCSKAMEICSKAPIFLTAELAQQPANDPTELNNVSCFVSAGPGIEAEYASAWVRFTVAASGGFYFTISPLNEISDIDFAFFHLPMGDCTQKNVLRCMAAGDVTYPSPCMGPTGLMPGETDTISAPGCLIGNNFLAPVQLVAGETYVLAINNYSDLASFGVQFCGTALLGCETDICGGSIPLGAGGVGTAPKPFEAFPNPLAAGSPLHIRMVADFPGEKQVCLTNMAGQTVFLQKMAVNAGVKTLNIPTENLPSGTYALTITGKSGVLLRKIVING